jgi:hypothetical protein
MNPNAIGGFEEIAFRRLRDDAGHHQHTHQDRDEFGFHFCSGFDR